MRNMFKPVNEKEPPIKEVTLDWMVNNFGVRDTKFVLERVDPRTGEFDVMAYGIVQRYRIIVEVEIDEPVIYL